MPVKTTFPAPCDSFNVWQQYRASRVGGIRFFGMSSHIVIFGRSLPPPSLGVFLFDELHELGRVNRREIVVRVILDACPAAKVEHDAGILAAGKGDVVTFGIPAKRFRLVKPQPIHRDLDLVHLNELHFF